MVKVKPTSPGRRALVKVVHPELHKGKPVAALIEKQSKRAGRNNSGHITTRHQGGDISSTIELSTSCVTRTVSWPRSNVSSTTRTAAPASHCCAMRRRAPLCDRPEGRNSRPELVNGSESADQAGQYAAVAQHPGRHDDSLHRNASRARVPSWPVPPATSVQLRRAKAFTPSYACARAKSAKVHVDCRATIGEVGQRGTQPGIDRQSRPCALARRASDGARRCHEPD